MSTFFRQTAQAMIAKHIDRFPLLKLDQVIDWQPIEQYLNRQRTRYLRDHRGRPAYPLLSMFKAVLLGQWHSLSDPELEHSLITRIDFNLFCRFDELSIPDYSTLCRYRNWLAQDDTLSELLELINRQLTEKGLKIEKASAAVIDATIIQTAGGKQRQAIERVHSLRSRTPKKAKATICRLVLNLRSQFFQSRLFFSNQEKLRSTTHRFGNTVKRCNSFRLAISTSAPINSCTDEANALPV